MVKEVRKFRPEEYDAMMALLDKAFSFEPGNFIDILPKLYKKQYTPWDFNHCVIEDGVPAAAIGAYYDTAVMGGEKLCVCGIGNVGVHPDYRGRGYMIELFDKVMEEMDERNADISILGGDRFRYGHFGYDIASTLATYVISARSLKKHLGYTGTAVREVLSHEDGAMADVDRLYRSRGGLVFSRIGEMFYDSLLSSKNRVFISEAGDAYCTVMNASLVSEIRMEDPTPERLAAFLLGIMEAVDAAAVNMNADMADSKLRRSAYAICDDFTVKEHERILVLSWEKLIRACLTESARAADLGECETVLRIHGYRRTENILIKASGRSVTVEPTERECDFEWTRHEASELLLSYTSAAREMLPAPLLKLFPLKISVSQPDMV